MKTWEVMKELGENKKQEFECIAKSGERMVAFVADTFAGFHDVVVARSLKDRSTDILTINCVTAEYEWNLRNPIVTWQEALLAWANGKMIQVTFDNRTYTYFKCLDTGDSLVDIEEHLELCATEILEGVWCILG